MVRTVDDQATAVRCRRCFAASSQDPGARPRLLDETVRRRAIDALFLVRAAQRPGPDPAIIARRQPLLHRRVWVASLRSR